MTSRSTSSSPIRDTLQPSSTRTSTASPALPGGSSCHQNHSAATPITSNGATTRMRTTAHTRRRWRWSSSGASGGSISCVIVPRSPTTTATSPRPRPCRRLLGESDAAPDPRSSAASAVTVVSRSSWATTVIVGPGRVLERGDLGARGARGRTFPARQRQREPDDDRCRVVFSGDGEDRRAVGVAGWHCAPAPRAATRPCASDR